MIVFCIEVTLNPSLEIFYTHLRVRGGARLEIVGGNRWIKKNIGEARQPHLFCFDYYYYYYLILSFYQSNLFLTAQRYACCVVNEHQHVYLDTLKYFFFSIGIAILLQICKTVTIIERSISLYKHSKVNCKCYKHVCLQPTYYKKVLETKRNIYECYKGI